MRVLVLGGTAFIGRRVVERLHERGDDVLVVHRGRHEPSPWVPVGHLHTDRLALHEHAEAARRFAPERILDAGALTARDVAAVLPALPEVPAVVLSSQDVYQAYAGLRAGRCEAPVPLTEDSQLRRQRCPYRGAAPTGVPEDYEKLDVEELWRARGAVVLRLPMVYGPHDPQRREDPVLRRLRAGRRQMPVGAGSLLWSRAHVEDVATGVLAALDRRVADGAVMNLAEPAVVPIRAWLEQIVRATGTPMELVRVPEEHLPDELALSAAPAQHLLVSVHRAERLLGWSPGSPERRVAESVRWHLAHPSQRPWTPDDARADDAALRHA